jgi:hypothetical protein
MKVWLFFFLFLLYVPGILFPSSRPEEQEEAQSPEIQKAPPAVRKNVIVLSDLDVPLINPVIDFINASTGLSLNLSKENHDSSPQYDLYMGMCMPEQLSDIADYRSPAWEKVAASFSRQGVFTWAQWQSSIAINTLFFEDRDIALSRLLENYTGKLTTINPLQDILMLRVFFTLYEVYGVEIIEDICSVVPVFKTERESLVFSIESGQYPIALGVDGYFRQSVSEGYPLEISTASFGGDKYPRTTVRGEGIAFIPEQTRNMEGAKYVIDFLGSDLFQDHLKDTLFTPVLHAGREDSPRDPESVIQAMCSSTGLEEFKKLWLAIAYPEGTEELIPTQE